jgi:YggT family protein
MPVATKQVTTEQPATTTTTAAPAAGTAVVENPRKEHQITVAERVVYLIGGILLAILGLRFLLMLLGANSGAGFANFIYTVSHPFVVPFFGLFNYREQFGASRFEFETLIAIVVYAIVMVVLARIVALPSARER